MVHVCPAYTAQSAIGPRATRGLGAQLDLPPLHTGDNEVSSGPAVKPTSCIASLKR